MMFQLDAAFALELIALCCSVGLLVWGKQINGAGAGLAKFTGSAVAVLAIFAMLCTTYYSTKYWLDGHFKHPNTISPADSRN